MAGGDELREVMRRYAVGVSVVTVDLDGERLGVTVASLSSIALEPPLVSISIAHQAAVHELLRAAGGYAVSMLAADQVALAQHLARRPADRDVGGSRRERGPRGPLLAGAVGWLECELVAEHTAGDHPLPRPRRARRAGSRRAAPPPRRRLPLAMIEAVVFDLDGVIVDSEQVWDDVREQLAKERGGRWHEGAQAAMMGMSSREWSAYMHDEIGLADSPQEINDEVVRRLLARYRESLPLIDGAVEAVRRLAEEFALAVASSSNRPIIEAVLERGDRRALQRHGLVRGGGARQTRAGRVPRGRAAVERASSRCAAVEDSSNGLRSAHAAGMRVLALPNAHYAPAPDALRLADVVLASPAEAHAGGHSRLTVRFRRSTLGT